MGSVGTVLSLDFRSTFVTKSISEFLEAISTIGNVYEKAAKLDGFIKLLEEELKKIDAFKPELPYSMLLLNDAILVLKEELAQYAARKCQPILEEFIPLKKDGNGDGDGDGDGDGEGSSITTRNEKDSNSNNGEKKNWMSSVQLWNSDEDFPSTDQNSKTKQNAENLLQGCQKLGGVREFMPFKAYAGLSGKEEDKLELPTPDLTLLAPEIRVLRKDLVSLASKAVSTKAVSPALIAQSSFRYEPQQLQHQSARKQRRCWSAELHRRFVDALEKLGSAQVATPKQIKELMQVDGLTNDEVKSHLQKYRIHARKSFPTTTTGTSVLGGSQLISQDQYDTDNSSKGNASQSGSPEIPLQVASNTKDDIMEDEEDANSENYSWRSRHVPQPGKIAV